MTKEPEPIKGLVRPVADRLLSTLYRPEFEALMAQGDPQGMDQIRAACEGLSPEDRKTVFFRVLRSAEDLSRTNPTGLQRRARVNLLRAIPASDIEIMSQDYIFLRQALSTVPSDIAANIKTLPQAIRTKLGLGKALPEGATRASIMGELWKAVSKACSQDAPLTRTQLAARAGINITAFANSLRGSIPRKLDIERLTEGFSIEDKEKIRGLYEQALSMRGNQPQTSGK